MALDTQEKRMAAVGVGRPYLRTKLPAAVDVEWRASTGLSYGANGIGAPVAGDAMPMAIHIYKMAGGL